ncbi:hypothetical protein AJ78_01757 [Emergomyces pasteurianus Ep9510]|uniref:Restriction of telomere capping protein 4 C-terminal domain-containing protein n=1 Tax=Emergomyces pasteurianus Ep9510 TaxID=1447872 RepID=A0A1J9QPU7_9EURO|nr:hypothetical protein AJ78_01757 [Emergomyces pasteurianus Ep9510]
MLNAKPRTPSPSLTMIIMCLVCNSVMKMKTFSAFNAANNRIRSVAHKKVQKHGRKILSWSVLHRTDYYGLTGHGILSEHVVCHFKDTIDSLTGIDSVVLKYDTVVYAQEVLVSELLDMLAQENMKVDVKEARRILKKSNKMRNLLNLE